MTSLRSLHSNAVRGMVSALLLATFTACAPATVPSEDGSSRDGAASDAEATDAQGLDGSAPHDAAPADSAAPQDGSSGEDGGSSPLFPQVRAIVQRNCTVSCHSTSAGRMQGLPVILDQDSDIALRHDAVKASVADPVSPGPGGNRRMPPSGMLPAAEVDIIVRWNARGGRVTD